MKVTIEEINGKKYTVVWLREDISHINHIPKFYRHAEWRALRDGEMILFGSIYDRNELVCHIATALPPLSRHPKSEDAHLLYLYAAYGLMPWIKEPNGQNFAFIVAPHLVNYNSLAPLDLPRVEITHCVDTEGNRVEIAIEGGE